LAAIWLEGLHTLSSFAGILRTKLIALQFLFASWNGKSSAGNIVSFAFFSLFLPWFDPSFLGVNRPLGNFSASAGDELKMP